MAVRLFRNLRPFPLQLTNAFFVPVHLSLAVNYFRVAVAEHLPVFGARIRRSRKGVLYGLQLAPHFLLASWHSKSPPFLLPLVLLCPKIKFGEKLTTIGPGPNFARLAAAARFAYNGMAYSATRAALIAAAILMPTMSGLHRKIGTGHDLVVENSSLRLNFRTRSEQLENYNFPVALIVNVLSPLAQPKQKHPKESPFQKLFQMLL